MDFRHISRLHGQPDPLNPAANFASERTVTVYKGDDEISICVTRQSQSYKKRQSKEIYVSLSPDGGEARLTMGIEQRKLALTAAYMEALGISTAEALAAANQLSATKVTIRTGATGPSNSEARLVEQIGSFALALAAKANAGLPQPEVIWSQPEVRW